MAKGFIRAFIIGFFDYNTPKIVQIKNRKVGFINRLIELLIVAYIIGWVLLYKKGYQDFNEVRSAVSTKLRGITFSNSTISGPVTIDVAEYAIPPQETNAFFVMTGAVRTRMQTQTTCGENPEISEAICQNDTYCQGLANRGFFKGNGPYTGKCVDAPFGPKQKICEVFAWCPVENDSPDQIQTFPDSINFTVFIKNNIEFPMFGVIKRNIRKWYANNSDFSACRWQRDHPKNKYCPIFILGDITREAGIDYSALLKEGGIVKIIIQWDCDLDFNEDDCNPEYAFERLDRGNYSLALGFNFRYADHYILKSSTGDDTQYRDLFKVFGIHFLVVVRGTAGKLSVMPLMINIGSGMALLGIATVFGDIFALYFLKARRFYRQKKYLDATVTDSRECLHEPDQEPDKESDKQTSCNGNNEPDAASLHSS